MTGFFLVGAQKVIVEATRKSVVSFPEIAVRELLANAMIHQDLQQRGTNPMVEVVMIRSLRQLVKMSYLRRGTRNMFRIGHDLSSSKFRLNACLNKKVNKNRKKH